MNEEVLRATVEKIVAPGKGILAADESTNTCTKRFESVGIESTEEKRRDYREMLFSAPGISEFISGVILFEETLKQKAKDGTPLPEVLAKQGIAPGIKVDKGLVELNGEQTTQGLEDLDTRLKKYKQFGPMFAKWRAVYTIGEGKPSDILIAENAVRLARYAKICQENDLVPIVEPEILINGDHSLEACAEVTEKVQTAVFEALRSESVDTRYIFLKPSMVLSGKENGSRADRKSVAMATVELLKKTTPSSVPAVVFLSGGQSPVEATEHLNEMNKMGKAPWYLSFSYGRALQEPALKAFATGDSSGAQQIFIKRAKMNSLATQGKYVSELE